ncbi:hypothetical protein OAT08_05915 [Pelagibacteraceae bacterium]|nr:hypothetical protein [Pelagibacteraceae bacterium]
MAKKKNNIKQVIINIWQGKLGLSQTFWLVFFIGGTIVTFPSIIFFNDEFIDSVSDIGAILAILYVLIQYSYLVWAYVATWRSATNFKPKKNQWSWGTIAKVYLVLNLIRAFASFLR